jgi:hypothetical protein
VVRRRAQGWRAFPIAGRTDQRTQSSRDIHIASAPPKLFPLSRTPSDITTPSKWLAVPLVGEFTTDQTAGATFPASKMPVLEIWTILRTSTVGRRPSTSKPIDNDLLLTFSQLPLLQVRIPRSFESFCARKYALQKHPPRILKIIKFAQFRHHNYRLTCDHRLTSRDSFWLSHNLDNY